MKKIYSILLAAVALLSLAPFAKAQQPPYILVKEGDAKGLAYSKKISPPSGGRYIITLESFVTGELTVQELNVPSAIVLVLDRSGSMVDSMGSDYFERPSMTYSYDDCERYQPYSGSNTQEYYFKHTDNQYYIVRTGRNNGYYYLYYQVNGVNYYLNGTTVTTGNYPKTVRNSSSTIYTGVLYDGPTRMGALHNAVKAFIDIIDTNDTEKAPSTQDRLGNEIAIVSYSSSASPDKELTALSGNGKNELIEAVYRLKPYGGTQSGDGMETAKAIVEAATDFQLRTTVLFTDGIPGENGNWRYDDTWTVANSTIDNANDIKKLAVDSDDPTKKVISNVFTVGVFSNPAGQTQVYMKATSSDYKGATGMGERWEWSDTNIWSNVTGDDTLEKVHDQDTYTFNAEDPSKLKDAFETIGKTSGGQALDLDDETTSTVDIVSKSFTLPEGGKVEDIKIYTWDCYGLDEDVQYEDEDGNIQTGDFLLFNNKQASSLVPTLDKTDSESNKYDIISVKGFDYSENWCGFDQKQNKYRGKKLSIEIPVMMDDDAVGGPDIQTNAPGSGIYIQGKEDPFVEFKSPVVSLPINIHIRKEGLQKGESSKFTIQRKLKTENDNAWKDVTSVFVTRHSDQEEDGENAPITKVVGLPSVTKVSGVTAEYVYRIIENDWSWSYTLDEIYGYNVVYDNDGNESLERVDMTNTGALSTSINKNPFIFKNSKSVIEPKVRHAESKVTNTFKPKTSGSTEGDIKYDDSKKNTGSGRE